MDKTKFESELLSLRKDLENHARMLTNGACDDANDLCQDTMLKILDSREKYVRGKNFRAWAFTIMNNIHCNDLRRYSLSNVFTSYMVYQSTEEDTGDLCRFENDDVISHLPGTLRDIVCLLLESYRYNDIVAETGLPITTVKNRIHKARIILRRIIGK